MMAMGDQWARRRRGAVCAVALCLGSGQVRSEAVGLTGAEVTALRNMIVLYWNVSAVCNLAAPVAIVVRVSFDRGAKPLKDTILLVSGSGPDDESIAQVYAMARRAILRAGAEGLPLPADKYLAWQDIELAFDCGEMLIG